MGIVEALNSALGKKAKHLWDIYKDTNASVAKMDDLDAKILAYNEAVDRCMNGKCGREDAEVRDMVLYWAYHNMADSLVNKNFNPVYDFDEAHFRGALKYYNAALPLAITDEDRVHSMHKIAKVHKHLNDEKSWLEVRRKLIDYLPDSEKRHAYVNLANEFGKSEFVPELLEVALGYVKYEDVSWKMKNRNVAHICERLAKVYEASGDKKKLAKACEMCEKAKEGV